MENNSTKSSFIAKIKNHLTWKFLIGIVVGIIAGYAYYHFVGCSSGTCSIASNPYKMIAMGALLGGTITFGEKKKVSKETEIN